MAKTTLIVGSILILASINVVSAAETTVYYDCWDRHGSKKVILQLMMPEDLDAYGQGDAIIYLNGDPIKTTYALAGLNRIWFMASNNDLQVILQPNMKAGYYNFSNASEAKPDSMFMCKKVTKRKRK